MRGTPITQEGHDRLQKELDQLKSVERPKVSEAISEARAHGDLKENAEYHAAREKQGMIEAKIKHLEHNLGQAHIIDVTQFPNEGKVIFGSTIVILDVDLEKERSFRIVGEDESDIESNQLSVNAPLARAMIGKQIGDEVLVNMPDGTERCYEILKVDYI